MKPLSFVGFVFLILFALYYMVATYTPPGEKPKYIQEIN